MVKSQSFNGDGEVPYYTVEWKDSRHIGFHIFGNQVPILPKRGLHYFESLTNIDETQNIPDVWALLQVKFWSYE